MHKFKELETVVLTHNIPEHDLKEGDMGAVVNVYGRGKVAEVEFVTVSGKTVALVTLEATDIRPAKGNDILHVREFASFA